MTRGFEHRSHGLNGGEIIDDTASHTGGDWYCFVVLEAAVLTSSTADGVTNEAGRAGLTLGEGTWHFGPFTQIELASGVVQMFNRKSPSDGFDEGL